MWKVWTGSSWLRIRTAPRRRCEDNIKIDLQEVGCGGYGLDRAGSGQGQVAGTCECGNEPSGSIKCGEFLDQLQTGQLLKKDSAPRSKQVSYRCILILTSQDIYSQGCTAVSSVLHTDRYICDGWRMSTFPCSCEHFLFFPFLFSPPAS